MNLTSALRFFWAHWTPSQADWLKLLSSTLPTSVTRPTLSTFAPAAPARSGQPDVGPAAAAGFAGAVVGAAGAAVGAAVEPAWQAVSATANALSSTRWRDADMIQGPSRRPEDS